MQHFIASYGYAAVFLLMLAESACIPVPSELIMLFGGALAAGAVPGAHPSLAGIIAAGAAGNIAGSYLAWAAGRHWGLPVVRRWGRRIGLREHDVDRAVRWFERYGPAAVFFGRLVPVVRTFISLPAGVARMPAVRFGVYTAAGCIPWTAGLAITGYAVGRNWQAVANGFHGPTYVIAGVLVIAVIVVIVRRLARRAGNPPPRKPTRSWHPARPNGSRRHETGPGPAVSHARCAKRSTRPSSRYWRRSRGAHGGTGRVVPTPPPRRRGRSLVAARRPGRPVAGPIGRAAAAAIKDLMTAAGMIADAAAFAAAREQAPAAAGTPADGLRPQTEAIAARIASAEKAVGRTSAP